VAIITLADNIIVSVDLQAKIEANTLTISDHLLLALASFTAALYPTAMTYTETQQQAVDGPALFVDYYDIKNSQRLIDTTEFTFGFTITYVPKNQISSYELTSAIYLIQQSLGKLESDIGTFSIYDKDSDTTDGLAHVTGTVSVSDITVKTDPYIITADQIIT